MFDLFAVLWLPICRSACLYTCLLPSSGKSGQPSSSSTLVAASSLSPKPYWKSPPSLGAFPNGMPPSLLWREKKVAAGAAMG